MKIKKIPLRCCVITKEKLPKKELLRIVRTPSSEVKIDLTGKLNGRGVYLKKDIDVITKAENSKIIDNILKVKVDKEIFEKLKELC